MKYNIKLAIAACCGIFLSFGFLASAVSEIPLAPQVSEPEILSAEEMFDRIEARTLNYIDSAKNLRLLASRDGDLEAMRSFVFEYARLKGAMAADNALRLPAFAQIPPSVQVQAASPFLESDDERERNAAKAILWVVELQNCDWKFYEPYFRDHPARPPGVVVERLVVKDPFKALEAFEYYYGVNLHDPDGLMLLGPSERMRMTLTYHIWIITEAKGSVKGDAREEHIQKAKGALRELVDLNRWWTDLPVAVVMLEVPEVRVPELARTLWDRGDPLVQKRVGWVVRDDVLRGKEIEAEAERAREQLRKADPVPPTEPGQ